MQQFLYEDFDGPAGTSLGQRRDTWKQITGVTGGLLLDGAGAVRHNGQANTAAYYRNDSLAASPDYSVSADLYNANGLPSVLGRVSPETNTFYCARTNGNTIELYRFVNGSASLMGTQSTGLTGLRVYNLRLEMTGTVIAVYVNGSPTPIFSFISAHIPGPGYTGVRLNQSASPFGTIDNLTASIPDSGPGAVSGVLVATLDPATVSSAVQVQVSGALVKALDPATLSAGSVLSSKAGLAQTLAPAAISATAFSDTASLPDGAEAVLSKTLAGATLTGSADIAIAGAVSSVVDGPVLASALAVQARASLARSLEPAVLHATASRPTLARTESTLEDARLLATFRTYVLGSVRAPAGAGYAPQRAVVMSRPAQTGGQRPPAIQETTR